MISQRLPSTTAWHMLPVRPTIELVLTPVSAFIELDTLDELFEVIELEELLDVTDCLTVTGLSVSKMTL